MTFLKQISLLALAACLGLVLAGCQPSDPDSPKVEDLTSIAVTPNPVSMEIGGVQALTVTGTSAMTRPSLSPSGRLSCHPPRPSRQSIPVPVT